MMNKLTLTFLMIVVFQGFGFAQNMEVSRLMTYKSYVEYIVENKSDVSTRYNLTNGRISGFELYSNGKDVYKKGVVKSYQWVYDSFGNVVRSIEYDTDERTQKTVDYHAVYDENGNLTETNFNCIITRYSKFNEQGKPELIVRKHDPKCMQTNRLGAHKIELTYDERDNVTKYVYYSQSNNSEEIEELHCEYDVFNNVVELRRSYKPTREFPVLEYSGHLGGGLRSLHQLERFRYVYNKEGLWTKKYRIIDGDEQLIRKRKYQK